MNSTSNVPYVCFFLIRHQHFTAAHLFDFWVVFVMVQMRCDRNVGQNSLIDLIFQIFYLLVSQGRNVQLNGGYVFTQTPRDHTKYKS